MSKANKIFEKAKHIATDKDQLKSTLSDVGDKLSEFAENSNELQDLKAKLQILVRMVRSHLAGEYRSFPVSTLVFITFALLYFVIPIDLIPDFIPALGFTDDASVIYLIVKKINNDIHKYVEWEQEQFDEIKQ